MITNKKNDLGKGIRALLEGIDSDVNTIVKPIEFLHPTVNTIMSLPLEMVEINPFQPRSDFDEQSLNELAESIKVHGVIQPITVRQLNARKYQLISGERRLRASKLAGMTEIPTYIRTANDQQMLEMGLVENIQREDLNSIEIAMTYQRLIDECELTQEDMAQRIGKDRTTVSNYLRLLKLPPEIQLGIKGKKMSMGHARAIINIEDPMIQLSIYRDVVKKGLSVRKVEELARVVNHPQKKFKKNIEEKTLGADLQYVQNHLTSVLGTRVRVSTKNEGGEIAISYFSTDDLNRILEIIDKD